MFLVNNISTVRNSMDKKDLPKDSPSSLSLKLCNSGILLTKLRLQIPSIGKPHLKLNATHLSRWLLSNRNYLTHFVPNILDSTQMSRYRPGFKRARQHTGLLHPKYTLPFQSPMKSHWPILQRTAATRLLNGSITKAKMKQLLQFYNQMKEQKKKKRERKKWFSSIFFIIFTTSIKRKSEGQMTLFKKANIMDWSYFFFLHLDTNSSRAKGSRWQVLFAGFGISKAQLDSRYSRFLPYGGKITTLLLSIRKRYIILQGFLNIWVHSPDWGSGNSGKSSMTQKTILEKCKA